MKIFKWINKLKDAEVDHMIVETLSNNKTFQKLVMGVYNTPDSIKQKIKTLEDSICEKIDEHEIKNQENPQKLLQGKQETEQNSKN